MKILKALFFFIFLFFTVIGIISSPGCANIVPPSGGPKDSIPPKLVSAVPKNATIRFSGKLITFTFDEYVEIKDKEKNLVINPPPKSTPTVEYKLRVVTVKLRDSLKPNTTYSINFGNAIRDINEGNIIKNFSYVFSTGSYIDSLELSGRVLMAITGKADSSLIVMLYKNLDDSAVAKERPRYVTTLDSTGNFIFHNLAPGIYRIYTLKDEGGAKMYTSKSQVFGFADSAVTIQQNNAPVRLYAYAEEEEKKPVKKTTGNNDNKKPAEKEKRLVLQTNISGSEFDILDTLNIQFGSPLKTFDSTKFQVTDDQYKNIAYTTLMDSTNKKMAVFFKKDPDTKYHIIADKEFAADTLGRKLLKNDTISFHTKRESEYAEVRLRFRNLDLNKNPVLQFVQSDAVVYSYRFINREFFIKLFKPGEYDLRILYDDNKNGKWDPGSFFGKHKQPEKVQQIKINKPKNKLNIKANWDNETDFVL
jgi:Big-like domain-containing protein